MAVSGFIMPTPARLTVVADWDGGIGADVSATRTGTVLDAENQPLPFALVGVLFIPARDLIFHVRADINGIYTVEGLRADSSDYLFFAYPVESGAGEVDFATRWKLA